MIEGTQLFLRVGRRYYRLAGGLTEAELSRQSKHLARVLSLPIERK